MNLELVYWRDAHFNKDGFDENGGDGPDDYIMRTVGWTKPTGRFLYIESERLPHGDGSRCITRIPNENVVRRVRLVQE